MTLTTEQSDRLWGLLVEYRSVAVRCFFEDLGAQQPPAWLVECCMIAAHRKWACHVTAARLAWVACEIECCGGKHLMLPLFACEGNIHRLMRRRNQLARKVLPALEVELGEEPIVLYLAQVAGLRPDLGLVNPIKPAALRKAVLSLLTWEADPADWLRGEYRQRLTAGVPGVAAK